MAQHWRRVLYPHSPFGLVARVSATHKRDQTVAGPPQSPPRSFEGSGSQTDPQPPWYNRRAGIIPFRCSPDLLGGKGTSHVGWDTGGLPSRGKKYVNRTPPGPCVPHGGTLRRRRVVYLVAPAKNPSMPASYSVAAGHSRRGHIRVSDAGGSRRSYRNGRAAAVAEGTPFPEGPPESSVGGVPGWHLSSSALAGLLPGVSDVPTTNFAL